MRFNMSGKRVLAMVLTLALIGAMGLPSFAASLRSSDAKSVYTQINKERKAAGVSSLDWDDDLVAAAEIRAEEIARDYRTDHSRPNGASWLSVSTKAWGENIAYGQTSASQVMDTWMNSSGHKANILKSDYTIVGVGCAESSDGTLYWVQLFGNGKSNKSWAGVKSYTLDPFADGSASSSSSTSSSSSSGSGAALVNKDGTVNSSALTAQIKKSSDATITVQVKDATKISAAALKAAGTAVSGKTVFVKASTMSSTGKSTVGSIYLEATKLTGRKTAIKTGISTSADSVAKIKGIVEKKISGAAAYVRMEHNGTLTTRTKVEVKVKLDGLDTAKLKIYVYDRSKETFTLVENAEVSYTSGVLAFYTKSAGDIVITNQTIK